jgi:hypothetical protein
MKTRVLVLFTLLFALLTAQSQNKSVEAVKTLQVPKIDGNLDDAAWVNAPVVTGFIQNSPNVGEPATKKTEVRIVYDNAAIYIAAYLYDDPSEIRKQFTARDDEGRKDVDYFSVFFDTYGDKQNGFQFLVTTANVQTDARLSPNATTDFDSYGDKTWEAVWNSQVSMKADGWVVEMRIPYLSLRFPKAEVQTWGLQFMRFMRTNNERSFWRHVDPEINGFVNQFGELVSLKNIEPPLRLSFSPYVSTGFSSSPHKDGFNNKWLRNGGMDIKYGLNESFTLDATLIPDFGQVISDNVINNLTPYEQKFTENRPFFTEGTELFNKSGLFYSRRIGRTPTGYFSVKDMVETDPNLEMVKNPSITQLYNGIKFSGRTDKKLGIGIFNAVTAPMYAKVKDKTTGVETKINTEPLANYNIIVFDQALKGRSYLTFTNTNVLRNGMSRDANVSAFDFALYNKKGSHLLQGTTRYSKVWTASPYDGFNTMLRFAKVSGYWQYSFANNIESAKYDPNDMGFLAAANEIANTAAVSYNQIKPTKNFITYSYSLSMKYNLNYDPRMYAMYQINTRAFWLFKNFWDVSVTTAINPVWYRDFFELQTPGMFVRYPSNYYFTLGGSSDSRKKFFFSLEGIYAITPEFDNQYYGLDVGTRYRFSNKFSLGLEANESFENDNRGYAFMRETNGDPIAGRRDVTNVTTLLTGIYNFTSRQNLTLRVRHYWSKVTYDKFYNIDDEGYFLDRPDPVPPGGNDENFNLFNLDAFFTWDFRLGSRLILGYKNWLGEYEEVDGIANPKYFDNLSGVFSIPHGNEITARFIYFLDYNQLRKKKKP